MSSERRNDKRRGATGRHYSDFGSTMTGSSPPAGAHTVRTCPAAEVKTNVRHAARFLLGTTIWLIHARNAAPVSVLTWLTTA